jgi:hypothetical protein
MTSSYGGGGKIESNMKLTVLLAVVGVLVGANTFLLLGARVWAIHPPQGLSGREDGEWDSQERLLRRQDAFGAGTVTEAAAAADGAPAAELACFDRPRDGGCHSWWVV